VRANGGYSCPHASHPPGHHLYRPASTTADRRRRYSSSSSSSSSSSIMRFGTRALGGRRAAARTGFTGTISGRVLLSAGVEHHDGFPGRTQQALFSNTLSTVPPSPASSRPAGRAPAGSLEFACLRMRHRIRPPHRSMMACATRPVTSTKARSPQFAIRAVEPRANCVAVRNQTGTFGGDLPNRG